MPHLPLSYRVVGEDDYMLEIEVAANGDFAINSGDYTSHEPRRGTLSASQRANLLSLLGRLGAVREHPAPAGASGFMATLILSGQGQDQVFRFWEGALAGDASLEALVRALEVL
ncbi:MAG: hypothetical protein ACM3ST_13645 [Bdellovibrio bacteriovorus]